MIHGVNCTGEVWSRMAGQFRDIGWRVEMPTFRPQLRRRSEPPAELLKLTLADYVEDMEAEARRLTAETGQPPVVFGHSMGGLIAQKLAERGVARAVVLLTPTAPSGLQSKGSLAPRFTFANILYGPRMETRAQKFWRTGFGWGILNCVPRSRHAEIYAATCYESGLVYRDLFYRSKDTQRIAYIDEGCVTAPILTIGAAKDRAIHIDTQRKIAEKYKRVGDYLEYADNAHWILDEPGTERVIADIAGWLNAKVAK